MDTNNLQETNRDYKGETIYLKQFEDQRRGVVIRECRECGDEFTAVVKSLKNGEIKGLYCGKSCATKARMNETDQYGENNPNWKGGVSEDYYRYKKRQKEKYPERVKARKKLHNAIQDGRIKRESCAVCGEADAQGHHEDYSKPLDVVWLCEKHHREYHEGEYEAISDYLNGRVAE